MSQSIKITESEFAEIKMLQNKFQESIQRLGLLGVEKMELDRLVTEFVEKEKKLKDEWISLQKLEQGLLDKIIAKYGEGNLSMSDGTFIPSIIAQAPLVKGTV
jgi:hypothetical protein